MASKLSWTVKPGGLSPQDHVRIFALAEEGLNSCRIARAIEKDPGTVRWFMYRNGLAQPSPIGRGMPTDRPNAAGRKGYSPQEDTFIEGLRADGVDLAVIAQRATETFGHPRSRHGVEVRLTMLAARDDAEAA